MSSDDGDDHSDGVDPRVAGGGVDETDGGVDAPAGQVDETDGGVDAPAGQVDELASQVDEPTDDIDREQDWEEGVFGGADHDLPIEPQTPDVENAVFVLLGALSTLAVLLVLLGVI